MSETGLRSFFTHGMWRGGGPETVSGAGSTLRYTEALRPRLEALVRKLGVRSFLDAPCGDFNWMRHVDLGTASYMGLDLVDEVIAHNVKHHSGPTRSFAVADVTVDPLPSADLFMCRDLLLHLPFRDILELLRNVASANLDWVLVTSYVNQHNDDLDQPGKARPLNLTLPPFDFPLPPEDARIPDWIAGFRERYLYLYDGKTFREYTQAAVDRYARAAALPARAGMLVAEARDLEGRVAAPLILRPGQRLSPGEQPKSIEDVKARLPAGVLEYAGAIVDADVLMRCVFTSIQTFGFFTKHAPRYFEYPEVYTRIERAAPVGPVVDLGAGVSPLPVLLSAAGFRVITVDYSETRRDLSRSTPLNEWGFLDYAAVDERILSINADFAMAPLEPGSTSLVYSVSVVEHMPAAVRRTVLARVAEILEPGGRLILTIDLEPRSLRLWNRDRGKVVEEPAIHGELDDILAELRALGMTIADLVMRRGLPGSATDIAVLEAVCEAPSSVER